MSHPETGKLSRLAEITSTVFPFREGPSSEKASASRNAGPTPQGEVSRYRWLCRFCAFLPVTRREKKARGEATWAGTGWREGEGWVWRPPAALEVEPASAHEPAGIG